jgi:hypothetical protein
MICIDEHGVVLTAKELYAMAAIISEAHGDLCQRIGSCCDMDIATNLASHLEPMLDACARVMGAASQAAEIDRDAE